MQNVRLAYILTFLSELYWPSVPALFFYLKYFSFEQIAILWAIQMAVGIIMEIPTGAFADIVGRKMSIVLSFTIGAVSLLVFPFTTAFWVFVILESLKGLANALYSGSMEALVYDTLKQDKKENEYPHVSSTIETVNWACWALSSIGGAYLFAWNFRAPWIIQGLMFVAAAILAIALTEPRIDTIKVTLGKAWRQNLIGFRELFSSLRTARITLQLSVIGAGYTIASNILGASQAREYGMGATGTGWIFGVGCLFSVIAARLFPTLLSHFREKKLVFVTSLMLLTSFLLARYVGLSAGIALILLRIASSSTFRNTRSVIVNTWISSRNRATALSTLSLLTQAPYIILAPLLGSLIDKSSPNQFAWMLGGGIVVMILLIQIGLQTREE